MHLGLGTWAAVAIDGAADAREQALVRGVAAGEDFALVLKYDERLYRPANVCSLRLPRARDTFPCCASPTFLTKPL